MSAIALVYGVLLVILGIAGYFGTGQASMTALIPSAFGAPVLALSLLALARPAWAKHLVRGVVALGVLGLLGSMRCVPALLQLVSGSDVDRPAAVVAQAIMAGLSMAFLALWVGTAVQARRRQFRHDPGMART